MGGSIWKTLDQVGKAGHDPNFQPNLDASDPTTRLFMRDFSLPSDQTDPRFQSFNQSASQYPLGTYSRNNHSMIPDSFNQGVNPNPMAQMGSGLPTNSMGAPAGQNPFLNSVLPQAGPLSAVNSLSNLGRRF